MHLETITPFLQLLIFLTKTGHHLTIISLLIPLPPAAISSAGELLSVIMLGSDFLGLWTQKKVSEFMNSEKVGERIALNARPGWPHNSWKPHNARNLFC